MDGGFGHEHVWYPLKAFGITHPLSALNATTIINTWIALGALIISIGLARYFLFHKPPKQPEGPPGRHMPLFTIHTYGSYIVKTIIKSFITLVEQSTGTFMYRYFAFTASIFLFILFCNWVGLIPFVKEPTADLNTTLALGIIALLYIQKEVIHVHGFVHYLKDYFLPVQIFFPLNIIIGLAMFPVRVLSELATVVSLSFRLFGNIFGGAIIMSIVQRGITGSLLLQSAVTLSGINLLLAGFFVIFEGGLQAFVFAILTLTNISMATSIEEGKD